MKISELLNESVEQGVAAWEVSALIVIWTQWNFQILNMKIAKLLRNLADVIDPNKSA